MSYVSATLRRLVTQRAREQCEYCRFPQTASLFAFEMEHIIAEKTLRSHFSQFKRSLWGATSYSQRPILVNLGIGN